MKKRAHPESNQRSERFDREQRIKKDTAFQKVFTRGDFAKGLFLNLWVLIEPQESRPRIGIIVSKKTNKSAAARNLWKRRIREAFRKNQSDVKPGASVLVQSRKRESKAPSYQEIESDMMELLVKTKAVKRG